MFFLVAFRYVWKESFLNHHEAECKITSKLKCQFKKATEHSICIMFFISLRFQSCYPGVLQDVIAENEYDKETASRIAFLNVQFTLYIFAKKELSSFEDKPWSDRH